MSVETMVIDGSFGEGGGQILRTSIGLAAALWGRPTPSGELPAPRELHIVHIRANRPKPGLRPQHLAAVNAAVAVCGGSVEGANVNSTELRFRPEQVVGGLFHFDIGTAGSSVLVFQTVLPALLGADADSEVVISGGTHNPMAPSVEYVRDVFATLAEGAGASFWLEMERAGFYPAGGGKVRGQIRGLGDPAALGPLRLLSRGDLRRVELLSGVSDKLPEHILHRQAGQALARLKDAGVEAEVAEAVWPTNSPGTAVFLRAVFSRSVAGFLSLGEMGKPAERVADDAVDQFLEFLKSPGAVDPHAADQLVTLLALSPEESVLTTTKVTSHLLTNAQVVRLITSREVEVEGEMGQPGKVTIREMPI